MLQASLQDFTKSCLQPQSLYLPQATSTVPWDLSELAACGNTGADCPLCPLGPLCFDLAQHSSTTRPSVERTAEESFFAFGSRVKLCSVVGNSDPSPEMGLLPQHTCVPSIGRRLSGQSDVEGPAKSVKVRLTSRHLNRRVVNYSCNRSADQFRVVMSVVNQIVFFCLTILEIAPFGSYGNCTPVVSPWSQLVHQGAIEQPASTMSATVKRRQPSSGSAEDALPAANRLSFPQQWRPLRLVQREGREKTDELWRRLDDLVTDASMMSPNPSSPVPSRPQSLPPPRHCRQPTLRPGRLGCADGRDVWAQGRRGCPRMGFVEHRRSRRGGREQSSWEQQLHRRAG